jgi:hypothetical protein
MTDHHPAVAVGHEDDRPADRLQDAADGGGVAVEAAQRVGRAIVV